MDLITILLICLLILFIVGVIIVMVIVYNFHVYKFKIRLYRYYGSDGWREDKKFYRSREMVVPGSLGEKVLWIPRLKSFCSAYGRLSGPKTYYYAVGQDGYLYNIKLGDIDAKMGMLDIEVIEPDVRAFHTTNFKNIRERYDKPKNWPVVMISISLVLIVIILVAGGYFIYSKLIESQKIANSNIEASTKATESAGQILIGIERLLSGGQLTPGLVRVNVTNG